MAERNKKATFPRIYLTPQNLVTRPPVANHNLLATLIPKPTPTPGHESTTSSGTDTDEEAGSLKMVNNNISNGTCKAKKRKCEESSAGGNEKVKKAMKERNATQDAEAHYLHPRDIACLLGVVLRPQRFLSYPRWCKVVAVGKISRLLLVVYEGVSVEEEARCRSQIGGSFFLNKILEKYKLSVELHAPYRYTDLLERELLGVPFNVLSKTDRENIGLELHQFKKSCVKQNTSADRAALVRLACPEKIVRQRKSSQAMEAFPRTWLLLSPTQLLFENYPLPLDASLSVRRRRKYVFSRRHYAPVEAHSPMFGLDCEMVVTRRPGGKGATRMEVARVTLVDESGAVLYDEFVRPRFKVINYLTSKSGITAEIVARAVKRLSDVQADLAALLPPDALLVGQSLNCDLHALRLMHPYCVDTSVVFNINGHRNHKTGLKRLAAMFLNKEIQTNTICAETGAPLGHCSIEDAATAVELVKLKLRNSLEYGDAASGMWSSSSLKKSSNQCPSSWPTICMDDENAAASVQLDLPDKEGSPNFCKGLSSTELAPAYTTDMFRLAALSEKSSALVDHKDWAAQADKMMPLMPALHTRHACDSDLASLQTAERLLSHDNVHFCVVRLRQHRSPSPGQEDSMRRQLYDYWREVDEQFSQLYQSLPNHTMSLLLFPGCPDSNRRLEMARCYVNIKVDE